MSATTTRVTGGPAVRRALQALPEAVRTRVARQALRMGGKVYARALKAALPYDAQTDDGVHLRDSVRVIRPRDVRRLLQVAVAYSGPANRYGSIVEYGGDAGQAPQPVWRRTAVSASGAAMLEVVNRLRGYIDRYLSRDIRK